jgi:predicted Zn-dependent protease with MMP-like domain
MRIHYFKFYETVVVDDKKYEKDEVISCSLKSAKNLLKKYSGYAWTEHYERDGGLFESTPITLGNNARTTHKAKYNRHL